MRWLRLFMLLSLSFPSSGNAYDSETENFLRVTFKDIPAVQEMWLTGDLRNQVRDILYHHYHQPRVQYWRVGQRTAWVLDEIGKERPITVGIVIERDRIEKVSVLIYRESRGWEVKSPAFTAQFAGAVLEPDLQLDRHIDGISGATLSVRALQRLSRLALLLHRQLMTGGTP